MSLQEVVVQLGVNYTLVLTERLVTDRGEVLKIDGRAFLNLGLAPSIKFETDG